MRGYEMNLTRAIKPIVSVPLRLRTLHPPAYEIRNKQVYRRMRTAALDDVIFISVARVKFPARAA